MSTKNTQNIDNPTVTKSENKDYSNMDKLVKSKLLGVGITNEISSRILEYIYKNLLVKRKPYYIVTPNPEILVYGIKHRDFQEVLNNAEIALCDGIGVILGGWVLGCPYKERFTGVEMVEKLCEKVANQPITVGFLGGRDKIAKTAAECLRKKYNGLHVAFTQSEWEEDSSADMSHRGDSNNSYKDIDILFVAFGFPKQEEWMASHLGTISPKVMIGVGGAFDQIVDQSLRPPMFVQSIGMGWFYRLLRQPWRIKRQTALVAFIYEVFLEKFKDKKSQS